MMPGFELLVAGACAGGSVTGFAVQADEKGVCSFYYNQIMIVIGSIATFLNMLHFPGPLNDIYLTASCVIVASLAVSAIRAFGAKAHFAGVYLSSLGALVAFTLSRALSDSFVADVSFKIATF